MSRLLIPTLALALAACESPSTLTPADDVAAASSALTSTAARTAVTKGITYTAPNALTWQQANGCTTCHIQMMPYAASAADRLVGLTTTQRTQAKSFVSAILTSQQADGRFQHDSGAPYSLSKGAGHLASIAGWIRDSADQQGAAQLLKGVEWFRFQIMNQQAHSTVTPVIATATYASGISRLLFPNDGKLHAGRLLAYVPTDYQAPPLMRDHTTTTGWVMEALGAVLTDPTLTPTQRTQYQAFANDLIDSSEGYLVRQIASLDIDQISFYLRGLGALGRTTANSTTVASAVTTLESRRVVNSGWALPTMGLSSNTYSTALAISALCAAGKRLTNSTVLDGAATWLVTQQNATTGAFSIAGTGGLSSDIDVSNLATQALACATSTPITTTLSPTTAAISAVWPSSQVVPVTFTLANGGTESEVLNVTVSGGPSATTFSGTGPVVVGAGSSVPVSLSVTFPAGVAVGTYPLTFTAATPTGRPMFTRTLSVTAGSPTVGAGASTLAFTAGNGLAVVVGSSATFTARVTASPAATGLLSFFVGNTALGTSVMDGTGAASVTWSPTALFSGAQQLVVTYSGSATLAPSRLAGTVTVTPQSAPAAPTIASPASNATLPTTFTVAGTAAVGRTVRIDIDGQPVGLVVAGAGNTYSVTVTSPLFGLHNLRATVVDPTASASSPLVPVTFTLAGPTVTSPTEGATFGTSTIAFSGTATAAATVEVRVGGSLVASVTADGSGAFSGTTSSVGSGSVTLSFTQIVGGNTSAAVTRNISLGPAAPVITSPANGASIARSSTFAGTGQAGATLRVLEGATEVASTTVPSSGNWSVSVTLGYGARSLTATQTVAAATSSPSATKSVTVLDQEPPLLVGFPGPLSFEATGPTGAVITYTPPVATDLKDGSVAVTCTPTSGSTRPLGVTTVTCQATDLAGNTGTGTFTATVADTTKPVVTAPASLLVEATGAAGAIVTFAATALDSVSGALTPTCTPASGTTFAIGATQVSCVATDTAGNDATGSFTITVQDTSAPTLVLPPSISAEATSSAGAVVTFSTSGSDLVDGVVAVTCSPSSGGTFPLGPTTVSCSAPDLHANTASATFTVTVRDTTAPSLTVPSPISVPSTGPTGAVVTYTVSATDAVSGPVTATCAPASGSVFAAGATTVSCSATDTASNTRLASFTVTVRDDAAPVFSQVPATIFRSTATGSVTVTWPTPVATDSPDGDLPVTCVPASGTSFPIGSRSVSCRATDSARNTSTVSFDVVVGSTAPGVEQLVVETQGHLLDASDAPVTGDRNVRFSLFASETPASGETPAWTDLRVVPVQGGYFLARLGDTSAGGPPLPASALPSGEARWLEVEVGGITLVPRTAVRPRPVAASTAGLDCVGCVTTANLADGSIAASKLNATFAQDLGLVNPATLATVATTGAYASLSGRPTFSTVATTGAYANLVGAPALAPVATAGTYGSISGSPSLAPVASTGAWASISGAPSLTTFAPRAAASTFSAKQTLTSVDFAGAPVTELRLENATTNAPPVACSTATAGASYWSQVWSSLLYCNGTVWVPLKALPGQQANPGTSCYQIKAARPQASNGLYWIKPSTTAFQVWCDMASGGWTLVLRADGASATWAGEQPIWTNGTTIGTPGQAANLDFKSAAYATLPVRRLRAGMTVGGVTNWIEIPASGTSTLAQLLSTPAATTLGRATWKSLVAGSSLQSNCNVEGFSQGILGSAKFRLGFLSNNEADCLTTESAIGFGLMNQQFCNSAVTIGNVSCSGGDNGDKTTSAFGELYVR